MKLVIAVVQGQDAVSLVDELAQRDFRVTQINSAGGFLREGNVTLLMGVEDERVRELERVIRTNCHARVQYVNPLLPIMEPGEFAMAASPVEVQVGGAAVFVMRMARYERL
jgi:uncharacterized protein YaaQ